MNVVRALVHDALCHKCYVYVLFGGGGEGGRGRIPEAFIETGNRGRGDRGSVYQRKHRDCTLEHHSGVATASKVERRVERSLRRNRRGLVPTTPKQGIWGARMPPAGPAAWADPSLSPRPLGDNGEESRGPGQTGPGWFPSDSASGTIAVRICRMSYTPYPATKLGKPRNCL